MDLGPIIGAGIGAAGQIGGGLISSAGQADANKTNMMIAQRQMMFQERMSNTAYQRATEDMRKAGLNPALAYQQGGASTPSGALTHVENTKLGVGQGVANAAGSGMALVSARQQLEQTRAQTANVDAQTRQLNLESMARLQRLKEEIANMHQETLLGSAREARERLGTRFESETFGDRQRRVGYEAESEYQRSRQAGQETSFRMYQLPLALEQLKAELGLTNVNAQNARTQGELLRLDLPEARNRAAAEGSFIKRRISPYLSDAKQLAGMAFDIAAPFGLRGGFGRAARTVNNFQSGSNYWR